jgi:hypothetical protein
MTKLALIPAIVFLLAACTTLPPPSKTPQPEPAKLWLYQDATYAALDKYGQALLKANPKDGPEFCSTWSTVNKRDFYNALLAHMATRESGRDPSQTYKESFKNGKGETVISTGLLQVSYESCGSYGTKTTTEGLKDPITNLECGVRILSRWIPSDSYIAKDKLGAGRYWSVMRPGSSKEYIRAKLNEFCKG